MRYEIKLGDEIETVKGVTEIDRTVLPVLIEYMETMDFISNEIFYFVDYERRCVISTAHKVSLARSLWRICFEPFDRESISSLIERNQWTLLRSTNRLKQHIMSRIPLEEKRKTIFHNTISIRINTGSFQPFHLKSIPLALTDEGIPWFEAHVLSCTPAHSSKWLVSNYRGLLTFYGYDPHTGLWSQSRQLLLSTVEKNILLLSAQGRSEKDIARILYRSVSGIKKAKTVITKKLNTRNITESILMARNFSII